MQQPDNVIIKQRKFTLPAYPTVGIGIFRILLSLCNDICLSLMIMNDDDDHVASRPCQVVIIIILSNLLFRAFFTSFSI